MCSLSVDGNIDITAWPDVTNRLECNKLEMSTHAAYNS